MASEILGAFCAHTELPKDLTNLDVFLLTEPLQNGFTG